MADKPYQQVGDYIPRKDGPFLDWCVSFSKQVSDDPSRFALSAADAAEIAVWVSRFRDAYVPARSAATRTPGIVRAKNDTRRTVEGILREYAQRIKHAPGVTFKDLIDLGIHVDDQTKTPIGPPRTAPLLQVCMSPHCGHIIRFCDEATPSLKRKPPGVSVIQVYAHIGESFNVNPDKAREYGQFGKGPILIEWPPVMAGKTVTYFGRWVSGKGLTGPWSLPKYLMISAGSITTERELKLAA